MTMHQVEPLRGRRDDDAPFRRELALPPGNLFTRYLTARVVAAASGWSVAAVAEQNWPNDRVLSQVTRAASLPAISTTAGWAAELNRLVVMDELAAMGPAAAGPKLLADSTVLTFTNAGTISAPGFVAGAGNAGFVAEGQPIPVKQFADSPAQLQPHKLAAIAVLTEEMIFSSNAEQLIGDTLIRSAAAALDVALFDVNAGTAVRPAGLRYNVAALTASNNASEWDAFFEDMHALIDAVSPVGGTGPYYIIGSPGRAVDTRLRALSDQSALPYVVVPSNQLGADILICVSPAAIVCAIDPEPEIERGNATALQMSDPASPIVNGGAPTPPVRSMFQIDAVALKLRFRVTWALRDPRGVAWLTPKW